MAQIAQWNAHEKPYLHDVVLGQAGGSNWWPAYGVLMGGACFLTTLPQNGMLKAVKFSAAFGLALFTTDWLNRRRAETLLPEKVVRLTAELDRRADLIRTDSEESRGQLAAMTDWQELLVHAPLEVRTLLQRGVFKVTPANWFATKQVAADVQRNENLPTCETELRRLSTLLRDHVVLNRDGDWTAEEKRKQRSDDAVARDAMAIAAFFVPVIFWMAT